MYSNEDQKKPAGDGNAPIVNERVENGLRNMLAFCDKMAEIKNRVSRDRLDTE